MSLNVREMADYAASGETPEILFWVGCSGSFDQRSQKITRAFVKILNHLNIKFAVLGKEEACTGDPAKRAGNEFVFQMLALQKHRNNEHLSSEKNRYHLSALLQHFEKRISCIGWKI
ncbi:MAG TPA: heterodisulfide reductase-related iron-sulfur binding cluster [Chitinophagales bacterium]